MRAFHEKEQLYLAEISYERQRMGGISAMGPAANADAVVRL